MKTGYLLLLVLLVGIIFASGCVQKQTANESCRMSLCDCKCHTGEIQEDKGLLCGINCLGEFGVSSCKIQNGNCTEIYDRESQAKQKCVNLCASATQDLQAGPCLSDNNPNWNVPDWVCDVAHSPRTIEDNITENQCSAFRNGTAKHFVEVTPDCQLIRSL